MAVAAVALRSARQIETSAPSRLPEIKKIAIQALSELAWAIALSALCIPFVASASAAFIVFGVAVGSIAVNTIVHIAIKILFNKFRSENFFVKSLRCSHFYHFSVLNPMVVVHESGHYTAARLLFGGEPTIRLIPFVGGWTSYSTKSLTKLGQKVGYRNSIFLISLAGPALGTLASCIALIAGLILRHSHPEISPYLIAIGLCECFSHAEYAFSALSSAPDNLGHDFVRLKTFGIHPLAAAATILALPVIIILGFLLFEKKSIPASS
jgi:hypothetical protein